MPKATTQFVCAECGYTSPKWLGKCPGCGKFNTLAEEAIAPAAPAAKKAPLFAQAKATPLKDVTYEKYERVPSGIAELDVVLGGGIVRGSLVLVGGDPGVGKSTLLTQVAAHLAEGHRVLYLSAEESCSQVKLRCERLGVKADGMLLMNETNLENAEEEIGNAEYVIVDSIQAVYTSALTSAAGSVGQVRECAAKLMRTAKARARLSASEPIRTTRYAGRLSFIIIASSRISTSRRNQSTSLNNSTEKNESSSILHLRFLRADYNIPQYILSNILGDKKYILYRFFLKKQYDCRFSRINRLF